ncbi:2,3-dihydroxybenzoate-AMP ligase [Amycolatopsis bartoniae]|nr:AMP-binding protein [Amycolatopsis bartoniae]MBB2940197.1 2,3-dihydroxybenzoate-AMP ligase [Amycolatopsis bartoniae]
MSYRELGSAVAATRDRLAGLGLSAGDRIAVALGNCAEYVVLVLAALELGAVPVLIIPAFREHELDHVFSVTEPVAFAVDGHGRRKEAVATARRLRDRHPQLRHLLVRGVEPGVGEQDLTVLAAAGAGPVHPWTRAVEPSDPAVFLLSSGTTGLPKAIPRCHEGYEYMIRSALRVNRMDEHAVNLVVMPAEHGFVMNCPGLLGTLSVGGRVVLSTPDSPAVAFELVERERVTHTTLVPSVALRWCAEAEKTTRDLSSLSVLLVGGARLAPDVAAKLETRLGARVQQCYGMSEGLLCYTGLDDTDEVVHRTQGRPLSPHDEVRVVDLHGEAVAPGQIGELLTRGPYTVAGYYRAPGATIEAFTEDGFYRTGDLVRVDARGNIEVLGRVRDTINRGGEKISAEELEDVILRHSGIAAAACVAMPHQVLGEVGCLYAVPGAAADGDLDLRAVRTFLDQQGIAKYKLPERLELVAELPLTGVGKVDRASLRADIAARLEAESR